jgi:hypothetical protein
VVEDGPDELVARAEPPVDRRNAHVRTPGDLLQGHLGPGIVERVDGRTDDPLVIAGGVGPQGPPVPRHGQAR